MHPNGPEIRTDPIEYTIHGHSLRHDPPKGFGEEIMSLMNRVWPVIKANKILHDGINRVVYDRPGGGGGGDVGMAGCEVFAGVLLTPGAESNSAAASLERKTIRLTRYAVWTHIGPYRLIPVTGAAMTKALEARGLRTGSPMVEVYGHWSPDESTLATQTFVALL